MTPRQSLLQARVWGARAVRDDARAPLERTLEEVSLLRTALPWAAWPAVLDGRVYVSDGNAYFNRPGPRIVESLEILAACLHPKGFEDFREKHVGSVIRIDENLSQHPI